MSLLSRLFKKDEKNDSLFELGDELNKLESERTKLLVGLGESVYKANKGEEITQKIAEISMIDFKISQKHKELKNIELTYKNQGEESNE